MCVYITMVITLRITFIFLSFSLKLMPLCSNFSQFCVYSCVQFLPSLLNETIKILLQLYARKKSVWKAKYFFYYSHKGFQVCRLHRTFIAKYSNKVQLVNTLVILYLNTTIFSYNKFYLPSIMLVAVIGNTKHNYKV